MKFQDLCVKKTWTNRDGEEKVKWQKIGVLKTTDEGKMFVDIFHISEDVYVFDQKERETATPVNTAPASGEEIPF